MGSHDFLNMFGGPAASSPYGQYGYGGDPQASRREAEIEINARSAWFDAERAILESRPKTPQGRKPQTFREELQAETDEWLNDD